MKRASVIAGVAIVVVAVVLGGLYLARGEAPVTTTTVPPVVQAASIVADGIVLPVRRAELAFPVAGRVAVVVVDEGDTVTAGQLLLSLDDTATRAAVSAAEAEAAGAQAGVHQATAALEAAQAAVDKATATREGLSDEAAEWRFDAADADVSLAEAQLAAARADAGATEARLAAARARAEQARATLADLSIEAPFSGTVASLAVKAGDQVTPAVVVVRIADLSSWEVETVDLSEASVAAVEEGARVELTFDALPDVRVSGVVTGIGLFAWTYQGTTVFPVTVVPDAAIDGLRWGLTATVEIMVTTDPSA